MLTAIEGCLEDLFETIETLPGDKVEAAEKASSNHHPIKQGLTLGIVSVEGEGEEIETEGREDGGTEGVSGIEVEENARESSRRPSRDGLSITANNCRVYPQFWFIRGVVSWCIGLSRQ